MGERPSGRMPSSPRQNIPRFPALLDTGNNFGFSMQDRQLREWAGIDPGLLVVLGEIEINGQVVTRREGDGLAVPEHSRPAGGGQRPAAVPVEDGQRDRRLPTGRCSCWPAITAAGASRLPQQRPRLVARSPAAAHHRASAHLAQASHPSLVPTMTRPYGIHQRYLFVLRSPPHDPNAASQANHGLGTTPVLGQMAARPQSAHRGAAHRRLCGRGRSGDG